MPQVSNPPSSPHPYPLPPPLNPFPHEINVNIEEVMVIIVIYFIHKAVVTKAFRVMGVDDNGEQGGGGEQEDKGQGEG